MTTKRILKNWTENKKTNENFYYQWIFLLKFVKTVDISSKWKSEEMDSGVITITSEAK